MTTAKRNSQTRAALVLLVLGPLAGCGPARPTPDPAPAATAKPAEVSAAELSQLADRMCRCGDFRCADATKREIDAAGKRPIVEAERDRLAREFDRAITCFKPHHQHASFGLIVDLAERSADTVCACEDVRCAVAAAIEGLERQARYPHIHDDSPQHVAQEAQYVAASRRAAACYRELPGAVDPAAYERRFAQFAQRVCDCKGDGNCILAAFGVHRATPTDPAELVFADDAKLHASMQRARECGWQPPR